LIDGGFLGARRDGRLQSRGKRHAEALSKPNSHVDVCRGEGSQERFQVPWTRSTFAVFPTVNAAEAQTRLLSELALRQHTAQSRVAYQGAFRMYFSCSHGGTFSSFEALGPALPALRNFKRSMGSKCARGCPLHVGRRRQVRSDMLGLAWAGSECVPICSFRAGLGPQVRSDMPVLDAERVEMVSDMPVLDAERVGVGSDMLVLAGGGLKCVPICSFRAGLGQEVRSDVHVFAGERAVCNVGSVGGRAFVDVPPQLSSL
jgi:hypothetical protein